VLLKTRPKKEIDWDLVDELLEAGCMGTEIAARFDMHQDTFYRRVEDYHGVGFTVYSSQKRCSGDTLLRKAQFDKALTGDNTMLIWLGKNRLKQAETPIDANISEEAVKNFEAFVEQIKKAQSDRKAADIKTKRE
jgi:hypothetical protein